jgi:hypothetical protein
MLKYYYKKIFLLFSFLILGLGVQSQNTEYQKKEKTIYDSLTYHYYETGIWDSVIDIGKEAIYKGYDFYYLRMRMGLAYDYEGNFRMAEHHYTRALSFVPTDVNAAYYKYFAALNGGRIGEAYSSYKSFTSKQKEAIYKVQNTDTKYIDDAIIGKRLQKIKAKPLTSLSLSYGYSFTGNQNKLADILPQSKYILYSIGDIRTNQSYINLFLSGNASPLIQWSAAYNHNKINGEHLFHPKNLSFQTVGTNVSQDELYGSVNVLKGKGWELSISAMLLHYKGFKIDTPIDTVFYMIPPPPDTLLTESIVFEHNYYSPTGNDYFLRFSIKKKYRLADMTFFGSYSKIYDKNPVQTGLIFTLLPRGNYSLYLTNRLLYYHDDEDDRFVYKVLAGAQLSKKINIEGSATFGNIQNTNEPRAAVAYNWSEETSFKGDISLSYQLMKQLYISLRYQITQKQSVYNYYQIDEVLPSQTLHGFFYATYREEKGGYQFNQHFIILSLNWKL